MSLKVQNVSKFFSSKPAVDNISFEISSPSIVGFLGPNGAGKTTTMRMITGFLSPTTGQISVDNGVVTPENHSLRRTIGYLPENNPLYPELEVHEFLEFAAGISGLEKEFLRDRMDFVVSRCGLEEVLYDPVYKLSKGYKQRVGLAQAIIHDPKVLILDEPTSGLDPNQVVEIRKLISELAQEKFVILSTHILTEVKSICDRVLIINEGKLVLDSSIDQLQPAGASSIFALIKTQLSDDLLTGYLADQFPGTALTVEAKNDFKQVEIRTADNLDAREKIFELCVQKGIKLLELRGGENDLEQIFRKLTVGDDENS
ncbi:MAG: ATP-binding cassette domain-containing protein [Candidatus Kryptoniota bacterium]